MKIYSDVPEPDSTEQVVCIEGEWFVGGMLAQIQTMYGHGPVPVICFHFDDVDDHLPKLRQRQFCIEGSAAWVKLFRNMADFTERILQV